MSEGRLTTLADVEVWTREFRASPELQRAFREAGSYVGYKRAEARGIRRAREFAAQEDPRVEVSILALYAQENQWAEEWRWSASLQRLFPLRDDFLAEKRRATAASRAAALHSAAVPPSPSTVRAAPAAPEPVITATFPTTSRFTTRVGQENETGGEEKVTPNTFRLGTGWRFDPATCIWTEFIVDDDSKE